MPATKCVPVIRSVYVQHRTYLPKRKIKCNYNSARSFSAKLVSGQIILVISVLVITLHLAFLV